MKKIIIILFILSIIFSCKKDELTISDIDPTINLIDTPPCTTHIVTLNIDSFLMEWDTFSAPVITVIDICNCDSIIFKYSNLPSSLDFIYWNIQSDSIWTTVLKPQTYKITKNSFISFNLNDSIGLFFDPYFIYQVAFEDCE